MPYFTYRAVGRGGQVITNKVEDVSKHSVVTKLKRNGYLPISVVQNVGRITSKSSATVKRNAKNVDKRIEDIIATDHLARRGQRISIVQRINFLLQRTTPIKTKDIIIFTQNFYLLKKANFNNIHALSTIIESTENLILRGILEDILAGVEARRNNVFNNGILR